MTAAADARVDIESIRAEEVPAAALIHAAAFHATSPEGGARAEAELREEIGRAWSHVRVARDAGGVVGVAIVWIVADTADLIDISTHPAHRRRGVARALLRDIVSLSRQHGARQVFLEVRRSNAPAIALYAHAGFAVTGVRARYYDDDEDALTMALALDAGVRRADAP
jgi:ribosomal-protein-alanine N-acetyltransferase